MRATITASAISDDRFDSHLVNSRNDDCINASPDQESSVIVCRCETAVYSLTISL